MSETGNYLIDIEAAAIAKILSAKRPLPPPPDPLPKDYVAPVPRTVVNKADVFRGEKDEVFFAIVREVAPAVWLRLDRALNTAKEFEQPNALGQIITTGTTQNRVTLVWEFFICAQSLRATKELTHGGPGVIGIYDLLLALTGAPKGMTNPPTPSPMQLTGWKPVSYAEPFVFVGWELLGQTTTAAVYELQLRTRVQL